jgi:hypothetical protein
MPGDRWAPTRSAVVRILPHRHPEDHPPTPPGNWVIIDRAGDPAGGKDKSFWWLMPANRDAHEWADRFAISRCIAYPTRQLDPVNRTK